MPGDPFAQSELQPLLEKGLRHRQRQQKGDDDQERPQQTEKARQLLVSQGVEELAVPVIEPYLPDHVAYGDNDRADEDRHHAPPARRTTQNASEQGEVAGKMEIPQFRIDALGHWHGLGRHDRYCRRCNLHDLRNCRGRRG